MPSYNRSSTALAHLLLISANRISVEPSSSLVAARVTSLGFGSGKALKLQYDVIVFLFLLRTIATVYIRSPKGVKI